MPKRNCVLANEFLNILFVFILTFRSDRISALFEMTGNLVSFLRICLAELLLRISGPFGFPESSKPSNCDSFSEPPSMIFVRMAPKVCRKVGLALHKPWSNTTAVILWFCPESNSGWSKSWARAEAT